MKIHKRTCIYFFIFLFFLVKSGHLSFFETFIYLFSIASVVCRSGHSLISTCYTSAFIFRMKNLAQVSPLVSDLQILIATTSTDGKCRVFSTFIKGVDTRLIFRYFNNKQKPLELVPMLLSVVLRCFQGYWDKLFE